MFSAFTIFACAKKLTVMKKILQNIVHRMASDSLKKKAAGVDRVKVYRKLEKMQTGLVFWVGDPEEQRWLKEIGSRLAGVTMDKLCFVDSGYKDFRMDNITYVTGEDLSFGGKIVNDELLRIMETPYDILLDLTTRSNPLVDYILKGSRAQCKVGICKENFEADVMIDGVRNPQDLIEKVAVVFSELKEH